MSELTELEKDIIFIRRDWMNSNSLLIKGRGNILIDTGYISSIPQTLSLLGECGVMPESISMVINTHFHSDHVGANLIIQEMSGAVIAASEFEANCVNVGDRWINWLDFFGQEAPSYHISRVLSDGELLLLGPYEFRVIGTPGHSPGGISFYCEELEILVSGDALWGRDFGPVNLVVNGPEALLQARQSLNRLAELKVEVCLPGHGGPINNHEKNAEHCLRKIDKMMDNPDAVAMHIITRVLTFQIMKEGGIPRDRMCAYLVEKGWLQRFNEKYFHAELNELIENIMSRLLKSGALKIEEGVIKA
jgi:glyoxylase-like metal-dependent hydrolase (beta-lactamase superfamily II)